MTGRAAFLVAALASAVLAEEVTPIQKVLQLMEQMKAKGIAEKKDEEVKFSAFLQFCKGTDADKVKAIEDSGRHIEKLGAKIMEAQSEIETMGERIAELDEDVARWNKDIKAASSVRKLERTDYTATHDDYSSTVDAVERALAVAKELMKKVPQSLLEERVRAAADAAPRARRALAPLLQTARQQPYDERSEVMADPFLKRENKKAYAYEGQSGGIVSMLAELRERFRGEKTDLEKEEMNARHNFETVKQRLTDQIELAERELQEKEKSLAERREEKAAMEGEKADEEQVLAKDKAYLAELRDLCAQKETDFKSRQQLRAEEIEALAKAIEIMSSKSVKKERLPGGAAAAAAASLAQLQSTAPRAPELGRVAALLRQRAARSGSRTLALAAQRASEDPFGKVKRMIGDLIRRLMEEQAQEADHNAWCTAELAMNKKTRMFKQEAVDELAAEEERIKAEKVDLSRQVAELGDEISKLEKSTAEATSKRQEESKENAEAVKDAKMSQTAVAEALAVLRDFYAKAAEATALVQQTPLEDAPETFDTEYKGLQGDSKGVVGMLEVIESDFARLEADTSAEEDRAAAAFRRFVAKAEEDKAVAQTEVDHKNSKIQTLEQVLTSTQKSLEQTQAELDSAKGTYEKLKPSCVDAGVSYDERVKRREDEMQSLREGYKILSGEDVPSFQDMKAEQIEG